MRFFIGISIILLLLAGCSSKPSLELVSSTVDIMDDTGEIGITSGEKQGEFIKPISLSYDFIIKNTGKKTLGGAEKPNGETYEFDDGIKLAIEPNEKLTSVIKEIVGINIYNEEGRNEARLGFGKTGTPVLDPNQEGKYSLDFDLGASEENPELRIAPPKEQLDKLVKNAMEATLVIYIEEEEVGRFDLSNSNK
ncbi:hypothetical protein [Neobacillus soli]|uniref:hypothetical protein n=1 Tax=Neobacillus soli TaxID=220688 RepID=UPI000A77692A|nr:hypothetical protein [Neobacillus soli]